MQAAMNENAQQVFGEYFRQVMTCVDVMKRTESFTAGEVGLRPATRGKKWKSGTLDIYVQSHMVEENALLVWHSYLSSEGYTFNAEERTASEAVSVKLRTRIEADYLALCIPKASVQNEGVCCFTAWKRC